METSSLKPGDISELHLFRRALEAEYEKRSSEMKAESEKFISEKMFLARRETERRVHSLREEHIKKFSGLLEREKRRVLLEVRGEALLEIAALSEQLSGKIKKEIADLRMDRERYKPVLKSLVLEALDALGETAVVNVFPGEGSLVPFDGRIQAIEEEEEGLADGGCLVQDARTRSIVVDNSIMTRWNRFQRAFIQEFSENFADVLQGFDRFSRELRIS
ncbi:MAG: hypothetical protein Q7I97_04185 [Thermovirgaceae bacterium]|nr:hypothetical protein [Thermovirgaceae bacterium]